MSRFTDLQVRRYSRQILLPEVGGHGQARLLAAEVAVDVDRPPGRVAAVLLAAAGVGRVQLCGAVDRPVDERDLGFPLGRADAGRALGDALADALRARNPDVAVSTSVGVPGHALRLGPAPTLAAALERAGAVATTVTHALATGAVLPSLTATAFGALVAACEAAWPREACGWLTGPGPLATALRPAATGTGDAFAFTDDDLAALAAAYRRGPPPRVLYHAHPRGPATLSAADRAALAPGGVVLHPLPHVVLAVAEGRAHAATLYRWHDGAPVVVAAAVRTDDDRWHLREVEA